MANPPLGYKVEDRQLLINEDEAPRTRYIFETYLALGSVKALKAELDRQGITSPIRVSQRGRQHGGVKYSRGVLYSILRNPIYIGRIRHKDKTYKGQHEAIIPQDIWDAAQKRLAIQAAAHRGHKKTGDPNLLKGLLFDQDGTPYSPVGTKKKNGQIYRYYISQNLIQYRDHPKGTMARIPAYEIEQAVSDTIRTGLIDFLTLNPVEDHGIIRHITSHAPPPEMLVDTGINRITVGPDELQIDVNPAKVMQVLQEHLNLAIPAKADKQSHMIALPFTIRRACKGAIILKPDNAQTDFLDLPPVQLKNLIRGIVWRDEHFAGMSMKEIAEREGLSKAGVQKIVMGSLDSLLAL